MQMCDTILFFSLLNSVIIRKKDMSVKTLIMGYYENISQLLHDATDNQASVVVMLFVDMAQELSASALKMNIS